MPISDNFSIEKASPTDIPRLVAIVNGVYRGEASKAGWTTEADLIAGEIRTDEDDLVQLMAQPSTTFLKVIHEAAGIIGTVFLDKRGDRLYLGMLSVDIAWQAAGIGRRMLRAAEALAVSLGCRAVFMQVIPMRDELMAWYARNGYLPTGERKPFDGDPKFGVPRVPIEFVILEKGVV
jgi:ribosomal protein S18 acetylase RimI-like enzyme